jgi:hypothetical protein
MNDAPALIPRDEKLKHPALIWASRIVIGVGLVLGLILAARLGLNFRHWMWDTTRPIRFVTDIDRGYEWGRLSATEGYLNQYEKMQHERPGDQNWLDYGPLRLAVMAVWGRWSLNHYPHVTAWHQDRSYALTAPVLHFNLLMEIVGIISAFFLTRLWSNRRRGDLVPDYGSPAYFFRGCIPGLVAALLLWFNPAVVLSAYGWPTWDLWIVPFFLLAALLGSLNFWFTAGLVIGIGAMFKGQQLLVVPVFVIWSLLLAQPWDSLKFGGGVICAISFITCPWLLSYIPPEKLALAREIQAEYAQAYQVPAGTFVIARVVDWSAVLWVVGIVACATTLPWVGWLTLKREVANDRLKRVLASPWTWRAIAAISTVLWTLLPWLLKRNRSGWLIGFAIAMGFAGAILLIRPRGIAFLASTAAGIALLLCMSVFHGSSAWYDCGLHFGTIHWPWMTMGMTDNLPGIMVADFNWVSDDLNVIAVTIPAHLLYHFPESAIDLSIKTVLVALYWIMLIPCCLGLGLHARRRDSRVLIALTAPWLMFFCFPPQIHERYLLFAAGISCICAGASVGMTLLGLLLSMITFIMTLNTMLDNAPEGNRTQLGRILAAQFPSLFKENAGEKLRSLANGTHPDLGYAVLLCALIFLYFSLALRPKRPAASVSTAESRLIGSD